MYHKLENLATDTEVPGQLVGPTGNNFKTLKDTQKTIPDKLSEKSGTLATKYQETVLDYGQEWMSIVTKMMHTEVGQTEQCHKTVRHYEDKVAKLHKNVDGKETNGKSPRKAQVEKLQRNEEKLAKAWEGKFHMCIWQYPKHIIVAFVLESPSPLCCFSLPFFHHEPKRLRQIRDQDSKFTPSGGSDRMERPVSTRPSYVNL
jgi:hypothetical protein